MKQEILFYLGKHIIIWNYYKMSDNILKKILDNKKNKINNLKKDISLESLSDKIKDNDSKLIFFLRLFIFIFLLSKIFFNIFSDIL